MKKPIPFSANIFHDSGDLRSRAIVAMDIAAACLKALYPGDNRVESGPLKTLNSLKEGLLATGPAVFDVRGELVAALVGDDTLPPREAQHSGDLRI